MKTALLFYSDLQIIRDIQGNDERSKTRALKFLYARYYKMAFKIVTKRGGTEKDTEDVFQEAMVILYENIRRKEFKANSAISTYLYSIIRNCWYHKRMLLKTLKQTEKSFIRFNSENIVYSRKIDSNHLELKEIMFDNLLDHMGSTCKMILQLFYYEKRSVKEIKNIMGYSTEQSAKVQKYKCMLKLMKFLVDKPYVKTSILEVL